MKGLMFSRFILVGIVNTIVGLSLMYLLFFNGLNYWLSTFIGNLIGACVSYLLNKSFTFHNEKSIQQTIYRFFIVIGSCYFIAYFIGRRSAFLLFDQLLQSPPISIEYISILFGTVLYTLLNYFGQKNFVFYR
ncbi:GtrA family protein [Aquibacillus saliphilus]|uniref:GtrA family protein n=1 Tax=Aquibacillus saliphilus TaxID=1909422 RepID=UPI001CF020F5|nr:GtrA family protein [Aquibacillus saliphilus]